MTDAKRLFDKSPDELRKAFVRNRFGQDDVFGLVEIEQWTRYQREVERPDVIIWQPFLARDCLTTTVGTASLTHLREHATRQHALRGEGDRYWRFLFQLPDGLYLGQQHVGVHNPGGTNEWFVLDRDERSRLTVEYISNENPHIGARAVVDVLFAEWDLQRPKWREARAFLCYALAEEVKRERAKAEHDVATAVAISADGTKIVHADWVVVTGLGMLTRGSAYYDEAARKRALVFPGATFRNRKILRSDVMKRTDYSHALVAGVAGATLEERIVKASLPHLEVQYNAHADAQTLCYGGELQSKYPVFFTTSDLCPSPLPDGGVAVAV